VRTIRTGHCDEDNVKPPTRAPHNEINRAHVFRDAI
jgi:hypothetical protein